VSAWRPHATRTRRVAYVPNPDPAVTLGNSPRAGSRGSGRAVGIPDFLGLVKAASRLTVIDTHSHSCTSREPRRAGLHCTRTIPIGQEYFLSHRLRREGPQQCPPIAPPPLPRRFPRSA